MTGETERGLRVVSITAGGAGMFCGSCMRDNTLAAAARELGADVVLVPTFTPIRTDENDVSDSRVLMGGVNVYLEQVWSGFGRLPAFLRQLLDHPRLLSAVSKRALQTRRDDDGAVVISLLRGLRGRQRAATGDLIRQLAETFRPEVVNITNLLIAGFVPGLKRRFDVPVVVTLQGDDIFLDTLRAEDRRNALVEMRRIAGHVDAFVTFSQDYRRRMADLFEIPSERIHVVPLGLASPSDFGGGDGVLTRRDGDRPPTLGYLARLCPEKGFHHLVDAFLELRRRRQTTEARLLFGGWLGAADRIFVDQQLRKIREAGASDAVTHLDLPDRPSKIRMLGQLDVFSVPTVYREPKGLFVLEALAAGVPVVQPAHGAFPEMLSSTGGGWLVPPGDPIALTDALHALLVDPERSHRLGRAGQRGVLEGHTAASMAQATVKVWRRMHDGL